jgi:hypothetical protein
MEMEKNDLDELTREIRKIISDNRKFLARVMDDDYEPDEDVDEENGVSIEL